MKDFRKLKVWEKAHEFVLTLYADWHAMPSAEQFGLTSQLRWAGGSIPSNMSEGCGRNTDSEFRRFGEIAMGSAAEVESQLLPPQESGFLSEEAHDRLSKVLAGSRKILNSFLQTIQQSEQ